MSAWRKGSGRARLRAAEDRIEVCFRVVAELAIELEGAGIRLPRETLPVVDAIMAGRGKPRTSGALRGKPPRRPVPSRRERWLQFWWHLHGELTHFFAYRLVGDVILGRHATARMRRAAWTNGFNVALGGQPARWLGLMNEHADGNEAGLEVRYLHYGEAWMAGDRQERQADTTVLLGAFEDEDGTVWI